MRLLALPILLLTTSGCVFHSHLLDDHGVMGIRGEPIQYQTSTSISLRAVFLFDLIGDASTIGTAESFLEKAAEKGASRARIVNSSSTTYWLIFPPLSFFLHPVVTTVEGDIEGMVPSMDEEEEPGAP